MRLVQTTHTDQWNRPEDPDINPHTIGHLIFIKRSDIYTGQIFNKWFTSNCTVAYRRIQIDPYLTRCTKHNFKWIKDLIIKPDTLNLTEGKWGIALNYLAQKNTFSSLTINKWNLNKLKSFCTAKAHHHSDKTAAYRMGEFYQLHMQ